VKALLLDIRAIFAFDQDHAVGAKLRRGRPAVLGARGGSTERRRERRARSLRYAGRPRIGFGEGNSRCRWRYRSRPTAPDGDHTGEKGGGEGAAVRHGCGSPGGARFPLPRLVGGTKRNPPKVARGASPRQASLSAFIGGVPSSGATRRKREVQRDRPWRLRRLRSVCRSVRLRRARTVAGDPAALARAARVPRWRYGRRQCDSFGERDSLERGPVADSLPCPTPMVLVEGSTVRRCVRSASDGSTHRPVSRLPLRRVRAERLPRAARSQRFCVDREEYVASGDALPLVHQSWTTAFLLWPEPARATLSRSEWQFACEGEELRPYPYGFERDSAACNIDQMNLGKPQAGLNDLRAPVDAYPRCLSPFGVHDMSGNVEEWVTLDYGSAPESRDEGAWWLPGKNNVSRRDAGSRRSLRRPPSRRAMLSGRGP